MLMTCVTHEKSICDRCERACYVIVLGDIRYCSACFDTMKNNPETKKLMSSILRKFGVDEKTWQE